ncbi:MAG: hypothetical protein ACKVHP_05810, partial [Verrucomicrobiales bacterium]
MNTIAGSYVLASVPRAAFVLQPASDDTEDNRVVWTCCKNNDGELGPRTAWERQNGLFGEVEEFDWEAFDNVGERSKRRPPVTPDLLKEILRGHPKGMTRAKLKDVLVDTHGFGKTAAYSAINRLSRSYT